MLGEFAFVGITLDRVEGGIDCGGGWGGSCIGGYWGTDAFASINGWWGDACNTPKGIIPTSFVVKFSPEREKDGEGEKKNKIKITITDQYKSNDI